MLKLLKVIVFLFLFVGTNMLGYFGYKDNSFCAILVIISVLPLIQYSRGWTSSDINRVILFCFFAFFINFYLKERNLEALTMSMVCIGPLIMFFSLPNTQVYSTKKYCEFWRAVLGMIIIAFLLNSGMAIIERITGEHFFGLRGEELAYQIEDVGEVGFRSVAIYGHPLKNALITSTFMSYVLTSPLKRKIKFTLWFVGYLAVLCFNERSSIIGNALLLIVYVGNVMRTRLVSSSLKFKYTFSLITASVITYLLVMKAGLAGRLISMGLMDEGSAQTRLDIWEVFRYHRLSEFLYGISSHDMGMLAYSVGVTIIENFWLIYLFRMGLLFILMYVILYFLLMKNIFREYWLFDKIFIVATFWLLASVNNSLAHGFMTLWYFLLLSVVFNPSFLRKIVNPKYIDVNWP